MNGKLTIPGLALVALVLGISAAPAATITELQDPVNVACEDDEEECVGSSSRRARYDLITPIGTLGMPKSLIEPVTGSIVVPTPAPAPVPPDGGDDLPSDAQEQIS